MISLFVYISVLWRIWSKSLLTSLERGEFLFPNLAWKPTNMLTFARKLHIISFALLNVINSLINLLHFINVWKKNAIFKHLKVVKMENLYCGLWTQDLQCGSLKTPLFSYTKYSMPAAVWCGLQTQQTVPLLVLRCSFLFYWSHPLILK